MLSAYASKSVEVTRKTKLSSAIELEEGIVANVKQDWKDEVEDEGS